MTNFEEMKTYESKEKVSRNLKIFSSLWRIFKKSVKSTNNNFVRKFYEASRTIIIILSKL